MSKHFDRVNNRIRPAVNDYVETRPTVYRMEEPAPVVMDAGGASSQGYDSLLSYWHMLVGHKTTLLCFALAGLASAIIFSLLQTPVYRARTSIEVQDFNPEFMDGKNVDPTRPASSANGDSYFLTQLKILQSDSLIERVADKMDLQAERPASGWGAFATKVRGVFGRKEVVRQPNKDAFVGTAQSHLTVRASGETRLVEVLYDSPDPKFAAEFANTLVSEFTELGQKLRWEASQRTGDWLTGHLQEMKANLEKQQVELQEYARSSGLNITAETNVSDVRLKELQEELDKAQADRVDKQAKFEEAKARPVESLPATLDDPTLRDYRAKLTDLERQKVELSATLTPEHYKVQRVQAQIDELKAALDRERGNVVKRVGNEYTAASRREKLLASTYEEQQRTVANQSDKSIHYDMMKREVDSNRALYQALLGKVQQASLASAMRASNVLVVDPAKVPFFPYKPNVPVNSAAGLFCGLFLGLAFVVFRTRFDRTIQAPGDMQSYLSLPELGVIPMAEVCDTPAVRSQRPALKPGDPNDCLELVTWKHKPSAVAESFRAMLTSILLPGQHGGNLQVLVVTSPGPAEGKTTVASNLSIAIAEMGRRVLLIDGDLRQPKLHKIFGVANNRGVNDLLLADVDLNSTPLNEIVVETRVAGLSLLPSGSRANNISQLLHSSRIEELLNPCAASSTW